MGRGTLWIRTRNVSRLYSEVADVSTGWDEQLKFYDEGVGTQWYDRIRGGAFGAGLDKNIRMGYAWLCSVFESAAADAPIATQDGNATRKSNGDLVKRAPSFVQAEFLTGSDIYIFGFSRGAFTARSLGGMINYLGLPKIDLAKIDPEKTNWPTIRKFRMPGTSMQRALAQMSEKQYRTGVLRRV
jgi:uncharacterized protein (DUF2235 family)